MVKKDYPHERDNIRESSDKRTKRKTQEKAAGKNHNNSRAVSPTRYLPMLKCHLPAADRTIVHSENRLSSNLSVALSI